MAVMYSAGPANLALVQQMVQECTCRLSIRDCRLEQICDALQARKIVPWTTKPMGASGESRRTCPAWAGPGQRVLASYCLSAQRLSRRVSAHTYCSSWHLTPEPD